MTKHLTPIRAIKKHCKENCCAGDMTSWKYCTSKVCPLYPYRLGKRPKQETSRQTCDKKQADSTQDSTKIKPSEAQDTL